jgi:TetR/AcrR family transcriptional regulator, cholesterol catabolism regulator
LGDIFSRLQDSEGNVKDDLLNEDLAPNYPIGDKRWEIVKGAASLFIRKGYLNTGVREIAEAGGITVGTLYHYFKSKDEIIKAFLDFAVAGTNEFVRETAKVLLHMEPEAALGRAIELYIDYVNEAQNIVLFWHQETRNLVPEQRQRLLDNEAVLAELFEKLIKRGQEAGVFKMEDASLAAHNIIVLGDMWAFRRWWLGRRYTPAQYIKKQTEFILNGLDRKTAAQDGKPGEVIARR